MQYPDILPSHPSNIYTYTVMFVYIIVSGYVMFSALEEGSHMSLCTCNQIVLLWAQACEGQREHQAQPPSLMISIINNVMEQASKLIQIYAREMSANCPDVALIHMRPHSSAMLPGRFQQLICFLCKKKGQSVIASTVFNNKVRARAHNLHD